MIGSIGIIMGDSQTCSQTSIEPSLFEVSIVLFIAIVVILLIFGY